MNVWKVVGVKPYLKVLPALLLTSFGIHASQSDNISLESVKYDSKKQRIKVVGHVSKGHHGESVALSDPVWQGINVDMTVKNRQFKGELNTAGLGYVPCTVNASINGWSVTASVHKAPADCDSKTLTLSGKVTDDPIANALVRIEVGGQTYATYADALGQYSIEITATDPDAMVTAYASGGEDQANVEFAHIAGTFSEQLETDPQNVTNVTTARYVLLLEANSGEPITNADELNLAEKSVDASKMLEIATAIKVIVDNPDWDLPAGYTNVLEFAADAGAVDSFVQTVTSTDSEAFDSALAAILQDNDLIASFVADEIPDSYFEIPAAMPGFLARGGVAYDFEPDGSGRLLNADGSFSFNWQVQNGQLKLTYVQAPSYYNSTPLNAIPDSPEKAQIVAEWGPDAWVDADFTVNNVTFTMLADGDAVDLARVEEQQFWQFRTVELSTGEVTLPGYTDTGYGEAELRDSAKIANLNWGSIAVSGSWGMDSFFDPGNDYIGSGSYQRLIEDLLQFTSGGQGSGYLSGKTFNWSIDGSTDELIINYADGFEQRVRALDKKGVQYGFFTTVSDNGQIIAANYNFAVRQSDPYVFSNAGLVNTDGNEYWQSFVNAWSPSQYDENGNFLWQTIFGWQVRGDGTFSELQGVTDGNGDPVLSDNDTYVWYFEGDGSFVFEGKRWQVCQDLDLICHRRRWIPLDIEGDTLYMLEQAFIDQVWATPNNWMTYFPHRINIYKRYSKP